MTLGDIKFPLKPKFFGRPFIKRSVTFVHCGQTVWLDGQDETWHAGRPRPWSHCVRWVPSSPPPKGHSPAIFGPCQLRPNACMDQDLLGMELGLGPGDFVLDGDPDPFPKRVSERLLPNFPPISIVAKRLDASRCHLVRM